MRKENINTVLVSVFVTLLALAPVSYMAYKNMPARVATVDLQKLVEEEQKRTMHVLSKGSSVSEEQRAAVEKLTIEFAKTLSSNIDALGAECRCVIVNKAALLGGITIDYTDFVRERIKR
jgi:type IV pilus biogenesis protein CpaD/CtpE